MPRTVPSDPAAWLREFLEKARGRGWCVSIYCTTCGALDFRIGLLDEVRLAQGLPRRLRGPDRRPLDGGFSQADAVALAQALARLERDSLDWSRLEDAVRMILHELDGSIGPEAMRAWVVPVLGYSWAGQILHAMRVHYAERTAVRRALAAYEAPEAVAARRAEKKRLKAEAHARRLEAKQARDAAWRAKQPKP